MSPGGARGLSLSSSSHLTAPTSLCAFAPLGSAQYLECHPEVSAVQTLFRCPLFCDAFPDHTQTSW